MDWLLKQADSIKRDSDDEHDCILKIYYIKNSSFSYCNDNLSAFTLNDTLSVTIQGKKIYPGDSQSLLKSLFPKSFASQEPPEDDVTFILVPIKATSKTFYFKINRQGQIINISEEEGD